MHRMTPILLAALVALPATVAAQENETPLQTPDNASDARNAPAFHMRVEPTEQRAKPGEIVKYLVTVKARGDRDIKLDVAGPAEGYRYALTSSHLRIFEGEPARTTLLVKSGEGARPHANFTITATDGEGGRARQEVALHLVRPAAHNENATFAMKAEPIPSERPGVVAYRIHVRSSVEQAVHLAVRAGDAGVVATVEPDVVRAGPHSPGVAILRIERDGNATREAVPTLVLVGEAGDERHELRIPLKPHEKPRPDAAPAGEPGRPQHADPGVKYADLAKRIARIEAALRAWGLKLDAGTEATP